MPSPFYIVGPTSAGKTALAAEVARRCDGEIVSADAFQVYRGLDILTSKPSRALRAEIPHHLLDVVPVCCDFDAGQYLVAAREALREIASRGKLPVVAGGTGLYVRALTHGLADLPGADPALRAELDTLGMDELGRRLAELDPACAARIDLKNKRRLIRALEVCVLSGRPFSGFRREWQRDAETARGVLVTRERTELHERIDRRVDEMFDEGVIAEIGRLETPGRTAGQAIGLRQIQAHLNGGMGLTACKDGMKTATRRYAKRQLTWFRRQTSFEEINLSFQTNLQSAAESIARRAVSSSMTADV